MNVVAVQIPNMVDVQLKKKPNNQAYTTLIEKQVIK